MSSPNNKSPSALNLDGAGDEKPRLTEEEKKQNHIASGG
jgi:heteromeric Ino2p/Ino4p transcription factor